MDGTGFRDVTFKIAGKSVEGITSILKYKVPNAWMEFNQLFSNPHCMYWSEIAETLEQLIAGTFDFRPYEGE